MSGLLERLGAALDPDRMLQSTMGGLIEAAAMRHGLDTAAVRAARWSPGSPLRLLLAGYVGSRNTGADLRVEEMIRQLRHVLGADHCELSVLSIDPAVTAGYFRGARQIQVPTLFPRFLFEECPKHHGVVACEGSMFKSKFATALSTMMAGALGLAAAEGKLAVGYGAEAGEMDPSLRDFVARHCRDALVLCRNAPSQALLEALGIRTGPGTDTAWTFRPAPAARGARILQEHGWDGKREVLVACPIHPFMWPTRPDLVKALTHRLTGEFSEQHYKSIYFHHDSETARRKLDVYLDAFAEALRRYCDEHAAFLVLVGMERLDRRACEALAARFASPPPVLVSDEFDMYDLVSVLRRADLMLSSRFHALVTSMPGLVPSAGVTMDERIRNLMHDRGHEHLCFEVDEPDLGDKLHAALRVLKRDGERMRQDIGRFLPGQLQRMGEMGMDFEAEVMRVYPEFPRRDAPHSWWHYLPPLDGALTGLLERHA